jgi:hypothetical protein
MFTFNRTWLGVSTLAKLFNCYPCWYPEKVVRRFQTLNDADKAHRHLLIRLLEARLANWLPYLNFTSDEALLAVKLLKAGIDLDCPKLAKAVSLWDNLECKTDEELGLIHPELAELEKETYEFSLEALNNK